MDFFQFKNADGVEYVVAVSKIADESYDGYCKSPECDTPIVRISKDLMKPDRARRQLAVLLEEMLHAHEFELTEKIVRKFSTNTARLLYKFGWRQVKDIGDGIVVSKRNEKDEIKNTVRKRPKRQRKNAAVSKKIQGKKANKKRIRKR